MKTAAQPKMNFFIVLALNLFEKLENVKIEGTQFCFHEIESSKILVIDLSPPPSLYFLLSLSASLKNKAETHTVHNVALGTHTIYSHFAIVCSNIGRIKGFHAELHSNYSEHPLKTHAYKKTTP